MAEIFSCLWEGAPGLIGQRLEDFGVSARDKVSPMSDLDLGKIYGQVAKALGNKKTALYVRADEGADDDVKIVVQAPPALVVGPALAGGREGARRSASSSAAASSCRAPSTSWPPASGPSSSRTLFASVLQGVPPAPRAPARHDRRRRRRAGRQAEEERPLQGLEAAGRAVPGRWGRRPGARCAGARSSTTSATAPASCCAATSRPPPPSSSRRAARSRTATRRRAEDVRQLAASYEPLRELLRFAVSEDHFLLREKLGTAIAKAAAA